MIPWAKKFPHRTYRFEDLPLEAKKAVVVYMVDARYDVDDFKSDFGFTFSDAIKKFERKNKNNRFILYHIPLKNVIKRALSVWGPDAFDDDGESAPRREIWPILLDEDFIQDGTHRLTSYVDNDVAVIPGLEFVDRVDNIFQ